MSTAKGIDNYRLAIETIYRKAPENFDVPADNEFFALYRKPVGLPPRDLQFDPTTPPNSLVFTEKATPEVSDLIDDLAKRQFIKLFAVADAILSADKAFDRGYSKAQFAKEFVSSVEQAGAAGGYALYELGKRAAYAYKINTGADESYLNFVQKYASIFYAQRYDHLISAAEFRHGIFKENPLTADEVIAIPFLVGSSPKIYELAGVDHSKHAKSVAKKFADAGLDFESNLISDVAMERMVKIKSKHKNELSGPNR